MSDNALIEETIVDIADKTISGGALAGLIGWASQINWIGLTGALVAVGGLVVSFYFQHKRDKRESELHQAKLQDLKRQP